jgi:8-oxo-dGTP pyrophosphatase MutT (NUDIX family)
MTHSTLPHPERVSSFDRTPLATALATWDRRTHPLDGRRHAAVAVVVVDAPDGPGILLTKRSVKLRTHAGQWALPGGRLDAGETVEDAALRELHEELGMFVEPGAVLGPLDDYPTRSGYVITPVVVWAGADAGAMTPNPDEVARVHVVSGDALDVTPRFIAIPESDAPVIQLPMLGTLIHAPTAAVVYQFRELALHGRVTRVDHLEQPVFAWR